MQKVNVKEARREISRLLDEVQGGGEVIICRRGKPVARLTRVDQRCTKALRFPDRKAFRAGLPETKSTGAVLVRELRDERG
ncbi:type II toxin-antitoxin system Phd/YefM family antitoxin [Desulfofustis limnaeus]|uniref:Antitoxin n=1 Tax=Desulfofustis limnaeus TaxID=2740163 RepID=A0ABM7WDU4_9BACT|nr:type II toxin-antitoxin system prevent-host-death family antitoxin [Desulfofustis limnaeus]BDD89124.1 antitoxin [Desulfofustis limnaeus]